MGNHDTDLNFANSNHRGEVKNSSIEQRSLYTQIPESVSDPGESEPSTLA